MADEDFILAQWKTLFRSDHSDKAIETWPIIKSCYTGEGRHYHTLQHLEELLREPFIDELSVEPRDIKLAIFFHDAVYDSKVTQPMVKEDASASWLYGLAVNRYPFGWWRPGPPYFYNTEEVRNWILLSAHQDVPPDNLSFDGKLFLDCDLAILGSTPERFEEYEKQIRDEYAWVPESQYRIARAGILQKMLDRCGSAMWPLYFTNEMAEKYERQAIMNLTGSILKLKGALDELDEPAAP